MSRNTFARICCDSSPDSILSCCQRELLWHSVLGKEDTQDFNLVWGCVGETKADSSINAGARGKHRFGRSVEDVNLFGNVHAALVPEPFSLSRDAGTEGRIFSSAELFKDLACGGSVRCLFSSPRLAEREGNAVALLQTRGKAAKDGGLRVRFQVGSGFPSNIPGNTMNSL